MQSLLLQSPRPKLILERKGTPMPAFDHRFAQNVIKRAETIPTDKKPEWGNMNRNQMFGHLYDVFEYCMGRAGEMPDKSSFKTRYIFRPLVFSGIVKIPKNVRVPRPKDSDREMFKREVELDELRAKMDEYLACCQAGDLDPPRHPFFGDLGIDGWAKFHVRHMDHHLRQFGA
jgi:hypothetical protein